MGHLTGSFLKNLPKDSTDLQTEISSLNMPWILNVESYFWNFDF